MKNIFNAIFIALLLAVAITGCNSNSKSDGQGSANKVENTKPMSDDFEIVNVETGWRYASQPFIKVKLRNISGNPVTKTIHVKYAFIMDDEIIDNSSEIIHGSSDIAWDNGLCVTAEIKSLTKFSGITMRGIPKVKAKVCFEDDSPIWDGEISTKVTAN